MFAFALGRRICYRRCSLNFKHIVKHKTKTVTEAVNLLRGYKKIAICAPSEVTDYEND